MKNPETYLKRGPARQTTRDIELEKLEKRIDKLILNIRRRKDELDLTFKDVAERSGLTLSTINNLIQARMIKWQEHHLKAIERALEIDIDRHTLEFK